MLSKEGHDSSLWDTEHSEPLMIIMVSMWSDLHTSRLTRVEHQWTCKDKDESKGTPDNAELTNLGSYSHG